MKSTRQKLASNAHRSWARWTTHLLNQCHTNNDGSMTIPASAVLRWRRQIETSYEDLTAEEKASDEREADLIIDILHTDDGHKEDN